MKRIVILGGGTGGIITLNRLYQKLRHVSTEKNTEIILIEPNTRHYYQPGFLFVPLGLMEPWETYRPVSTLIPENVRWIRDKATLIDPDNRVVKTTEAEIKYDYLVISTGSHLDYDAVPGLKEHTHNFYSYDSTMRFKKALNEFKGGDVVIGVAGVPYKCPPAPIEMTLMLADYFKRIGLSDKVNIRYIYPLPRVFPIESVAELLGPIMDERGIETNLMFNLEGLDPKKREIYSLEGETVKYDMAVIIPPHKGAQVIIDSGLGDRSGWIPTDRHTLNMKGYDDVYVIGDATDLPVSKAGSVADFQAEVVTSRILADIEGYIPTARYNGRVMCFVVTGLGEGTTIVFDYENPPKPNPPNFACYWLKLMYNKLYWTLTAKSILPGVIV